MTGDPANKGFIMHGGTANITGPMAIGDNAQATGVSSTTVLAPSQRDDLRHRVQALRTAIEGHREDLTDPDATLQTADDLLAELDHPSPPHHRVQALLTHLANLSQPVTALTTVIATLYQIVNP